MFRVSIGDWEMKGDRSFDQKGSRQLCNVCDMRIIIIDYSTVDSSTIARDR